MQGQEQGPTGQVGAWPGERPDTSSCMTSGIKSLCRLSPQLNCLKQGLRYIPCSFLACTTRLPLLQGIVHVCSHGRRKPGPIPGLCRQSSPRSSGVVYPPLLIPETVKTFLSDFQVLLFQTQQSEVNSNISWKMCLLYFCWLCLQDLQVLCLVGIYFVWAFNMI